MKIGKGIIGLTIILPILLVLGCAGNSSSTLESQRKDKIIIKAAHTTSTDYPYQIGLEAMKKSLAEKTGGKVELQIFPNAQLGGNEREVVESLQLGTVTMTVVNGAVISNFTPKADVFNLPFIFRDYQHLYKAIDGEPGQIVANELKPKNLKVLAWYVNPERYIFTTKKVVTSLPDLKGLKIRVTQSPVSIETFNSLGALATPMAYGELYSALQQGVVDGGENDWFGIRGQKFFEVAPQIALTGHFMVACPLLVSEKWFNALPADIQKAVMESAIVGRDAMRKYMEDDLAKIQKEVEAKGGKVVKVNDIDAWRKAVAPVYVKFEKQIGKDLIEKVQNIK